MKTRQPNPAPDGALPVAGRHAHRRPPAAQRGAASLLVVMVLSFVLLLTAAYTNRNLIFEQQTSVNQYRSTQAFEAAEAGLEWAAALLNGGRIDDACVETGSPAGLSFRQRYLVVDAATGVLTAATQPSSGAMLTPTCTADGNGWRCHCPSDSAPSLAAAAGGGTSPAFRVRFVAASTTLPGVVRVEVSGCTRLAESCLQFPAIGLEGEGRAGLSALLALKPALSTQPAAAVTVLGSIEGAGALAAYNTDPGRGGVTIQAGGTVDPAGKVLRSVPGTPGPASVAAGDATLQALGAAPDRVFASFTGVWPDTYRLQPAAVRLDCPLGGCRQTLADLAAAHPGRVLWVNGDLVLESDGDIGNAAEPLTLFVAGQVNATAAARIFGFVYARGGWTGGGTVRGALFSEATLTAAAAPTVIYDGALLETIRRRSGSFVRLPGGWRDLP
jgi:PilX N-terminal